MKKYRTTKKIKERHWKFEQKSALNRNCDVTDTPPPEWSTWLPVRKCRFSSETDPFFLSFLFFFFSLLSRKHVKNRFVRDESHSITEVPLYSLTGYIIRKTNLHTHGTFSSLPRKSTLRYDNFFFIHITMVFGSYVFRSVDAFLYLPSLGYL